MFHNPKQINGYYEHILRRMPRFFIESLFLGGVSHGSLIKLFPSRVRTNNCQSPLQADLPIKNKNETKR